MDLAKADGNLSSASHRYGRRLARPSLTVHFIQGCRYQYHHQVQRHAATFWCCVPPSRFPSLLPVLRAPTSLPSPSRWRPMVAIAAARRCSCVASATRYCSPLAGPSSALRVVNGSYTWRWRCGCGTAASSNGLECQMQP